MRYDKEGLSYYDGHWMDNNRHGFGMRRYASGNIYKGDWRDNVRHGMGTMHWYNKNERYEGQWENGIQHGHGEHSWYLKRIPGSQYPLRNYYVGEWVNGMRHGHGTFYYATGAKYVGEWMNNMKHGHGKYVFKNGLVFEGVYNMEQWRGEVIMSPCHGSQISGSLKSMILQIWKNKKKKIPCRTFPSMIAIRNKMGASNFLLSFDSANGHHC